jgi:hypothetical protein
MKGVMSVEQTGAFPLILTFSLGEKEQPLVDFVEPGCC